MTSPGLSTSVCGIIGLLSGSVYSWMSRLERRQLEVLLVLFRAVMAAREREDQRVAALELAERPDGAGVVGQRVIGEDAAGGDVGTHGGR